jgi:outer membrane protein assembly factor BamB
MNIDLDRQWIYVYNKVIGKNPEQMYAYHINTEYYTPQLTEEQYTVSQGFVIERVVADNASIFTRVGIDEKNIYFGNSLGYCKAVDKKTGELRWLYKTDAMLFSRPAVIGKYVVLPTSDKRLVWLDKKTGKPRWQYDAAGPYVADGVVKDGILYQGGFKTFQVNTRLLLGPLDKELMNFSPTKGFHVQVPVIILGTPVHIYLRRIVLGNGPCIGPNQQIDANKRQYSKDRGN